MRHLFLTVGTVLLVAACGSGNDQAREADAAAPVAATTSAAVPVSPSTSSRSVADADRAALLSTLKLTADAKGQVLNECGERITPQLLSVDLGKGVGRAILVVMTGGPQQASCYGDGPGLTLMRQADVGWKEIYSSRGGFLLVMPELHNGAHEIAFGGPGFSHPVWQWNGTEYELSRREVSDDKIANAVTLP